jgi:Protein of unknown function (DUF433)
MTILDRITDGAFPIQRLPTIRATGITVGSVLTLVASGKTAAEIVVLSPSLEVDDVQAALEFLRLFLFRGPATRAAMTLGMRRRDLIAILETVGIPGPLRSSGATARPLIVSPPREGSSTSKLSSRRPSVQRPSGSLPALFRQARHETTSEFILERCESVTGIWLSSLRSSAGIGGIR